MFCTGSIGKKEPALRKDKKVEYLELIYDLIFVFMLQRDNALLHPEANGFFGWNEFSPYFLSTMTVLQIWAYSTLYINRYGENTFLDFVFVFVNMYLLYFMGTETRLDWWADYGQYNTAWGLILVNLGIQYLLKAKHVAPRHPKAKRLTHDWAIFYFLEAAFVFLTIPVFYSTGVSLVRYAVITGFIGPVLASRNEEALPLSFEHLSERVMLFVVFTFGEMIISITEYFSDIVTLQVIAVSGAAFLTVIGLFRSYGYLYNHVINRDARRGHKRYMAMHIPIILALSAVSVCLEYLSMPEINDFYTAMLLSVSLIIYYVSLFIITPHPKYEGYSDRKYVVLGLILCAILPLVMWLVNGKEALVLTTSMAFVWLQFTLIVKRRWSTQHAKEEDTRRRATEALAEIRH